MAVDNSLSIEQIKCRIAPEIDGSVEAVFDIYWFINSSDKGMYQVYITDEDGTKVVEEKDIAGTSCRMFINMNPEKLYYVTVANAKDKIKSTPVRLPSERMVWLNHVNSSTKNVITFNRTIIGPLPDQIYIRLQDEKNFYEQINIDIKDTSLDLNICQMDPPEKFYVNIGCTKMVNNALIIQEILDEDDILVEMEQPDLTEIKVLGWNNMKLKVNIFSETTFTNVDTVYQVGLISQNHIIAVKTMYKLENIESMEIDFELDDFLYGLDSDYQLEICLENRYWTSHMSKRAVLYLDSPLIQDKEYVDSDTIWIKLKEQNKITGHVAKITKDNGELTFELFFGNHFLCPYRGVSQIEFARKEGRTTGAYSVPVILEEDGYYLEERDKHTIVYRNKKAGVPEITEIKIELPITEGVDIKVGCFGLKTNKETNSLILDSLVWDFSNDRSHLLDEYNRFLDEVEKYLSSEYVHIIKNAIAMNLPQTTEEMPFFHYGYHNEKKIDLFPGMIIKTEYENYQTAYYSVYQRQDKLVFDPFAIHLLNEDSEYLGKLIQPDGNNEHFSYGGAGVIDLMYTELQKPYGAIVYPIRFMPVSLAGTVHTNENICLVMAEDHKTLKQAIEELRETGTKTEGAAIAYMKGRVHITPCIMIHINQKPEIVPIFTTYGDISDLYGGIKLTSIKRNGLNISTGANSQEMLRKLPVLHGDRIEL